MGRLKRTLWGAFELISSEDYSLQCGNTTETSPTVGRPLKVWLFFNGPKDDRFTANFMCSLWYAVISILGDQGIRLLVTQTMKLSLTLANGSSKTSMHLRRILKIFMKQNILSDLSLHWVNIVPYGVTWRQVGTNYQLSSWFPHSSWMFLKGFWGFWIRTQIFTFRKHLSW